MSPEDRALLERWTASVGHFPENRCVHQLIEAQAARTPEFPAVICGEVCLTYSGLETRANRLARRLAIAGIGREAVVGIHLDRTADLVVALLAVWKAGGAYVPLDPAHPPARLIQTITDAAIPLVLTEPAWASSFRLPPGTATICLERNLETSAEEAAGPPDVAHDPGQLAQVFDSSGSADRPTGVEITHRSVVNLLSAFHRDTGFSSTDVFLAITPISFDIAELELCLPLIAGGRVAIASRAVAVDARRLAAELVRTGATFFFATPTTWQMLIESGWEGHPGLTALCGGETLTPELAQAILPRVKSLWNLYGPTETTVCATAGPVLPGLPIRIGKPLPNTTARILDEKLELSPIGVAGELCLGGAGLARGYRGRPDLTAERFIPDPYAPGQRLYRTGDRVRWDAQGSLEYLGRLESRMKPFESPRTEAERRVAELFGEVLAVARVGRNDDFLELGGHSILAMRLINRLEAAGGRRLSLARLLESPTVADVAAALEAPPGADGPRPRAPHLAGPKVPAPVAVLRGDRVNAAFWAPDTTQTRNPAIAATDRPPLSYSGLADFIAAAATWLRSAGLGPKDAAAVVLPNGPAAATAFLATATAGACAPLNPAYRAEEFAFYLDDLKPRLLLVAEDLESPARAEARKRGIRIVEIAVPPEAPAGIFTLDGRVPEAGAPIAPAPRETALILHTSGTTARPKMVPLTQANLSASAAHIAATLGLGPDDRCLNVMPLFHIHGLVAGVLASLRAGASVVCAPGFFAPSFFHWLEKSRPTWYTAVPTMHQAILARAAEPEHREILGTHTLRFARSSSAALPRRVLEELERAFGVPVVEAYGMTEAAHQMTSNPLPPGIRRPGSVGRAAGPEIAVLDAEGRRLAPGETGEVCIRGPNVTAGYLNNPEANARAFWQGWLRTGDEGVLDREGYLTLTGRLKEQINRGGEKISPLEVDGVLMDHPAVATALSFPVSHPVLGEDIAAAVVLRPGDQVTERELRDYVATRLAYFKTPRRIVFVEAIPTGPTGKLQRLGLAERLNVTADVPVDDLDLTPPRTAVEEIVAAAWADVMDTSAPGVRRNFFALGGDSILATRLVAQLRERLAIELPLLAVFDAPTVEGISKAVEILLGEEPGPRDPVSASEARDRIAFDPAQSPTTLPMRANRELAPATSEQRILWEIERAAPGTSAYNLAISRRIEGPLDLNILAGAFEDLANRYEAFRTGFEEGAGGLLQRIAFSGQLPIEVLDFRDRPRANAEEAARTALEERAARPFDLTRPPLCRVTVARLADQDTLLLLAVHHAVCDGWSVPLIVNGLAEAYAARAEGRVADPRPTTADFGDYAAWLATPECLARRRHHLEYWRTLLDGADLSVDLPTDHPPPAHLTFEGHTERVLLPKEMLARLEHRARAHDTTLNVVLLASFRILLYRLGGQEDLTLGTVLAGRDTIDVERMVGYFARTVLIRTRITGETTFSELVQETRTGIVDALDHPASLEDVVRGLRAPMDWAFRLIFSFNEEPRLSVSLGSSPMHAMPTGNPGAKVDLGLAITRRDEGLEVALSTRAALYEQETTRRFLRLYQALLDAVVCGTPGPVSRFPLLSDDERERVLSLAAGPRLPTRITRTLGELFLEQAERSPHRTALISESGTWSFEMVAERAGHLAADLARRGVGPGDIVAIVGGRTPEIVMAMVAVILSGAAYLPVDSDQPAERVRGMLEDAEVRLVLADASGAAVAGDQAPVQRLDQTGAPATGPESPPRSARPEDPAYLIFTSGSTGRPKGVMVPHRALINHMDWALDTFPIGPSDVILHRTPMGFDASVWEIWGPLLAGCPMVLARRDRDAEPLYIGETIRAHGVTEIQLVPSMLTMLLELDGLRGCDTLKRVLCGGEPLSANLARRFHSTHGAELINLYGPTEVTIDATSWRSYPGFTETSVPIGRPIANQRAYVLDAYREPLPIGIPGELYLGGVGVALGYLNRPDLTAERFVPDPFGPEGADRMYRTGDRARFKADGNIEYLGRVDDQLKLNGLRIEPGEIEALLNARPDVVESAVGVVTEGRSGARLVAWVVPYPGAAPSVETLRGELSSTLPRSLVPSTVVLLDHLPRMPSGKIDRRALPAPIAAPVPYEPPGTPMEERVAEVWAEIFGKEQIGRQDDLFALGGHSLLAIRIANRLRAHGAIEITLRTILEHPTVASLAAELDRLTASDLPAAGAAIPKIKRAARVLRPAGSRPPPSVS